MKRLVLAVVACIGILGIGLIAKNSLEKHVFAASCRSNQLSTTDKLKQQAESITVRVLSGNGGGSGTLIAKEGQVYTVLTNQHVLTSGEPYRIQTPDGSVYSADVVKKVNFGVNDLALLQFTSLGSNYAVASLPEKSKLVQETRVLKNLVENEEVFAAGFVDDANGNDQGKPPLKFNTGKITLLLDKSFQGGYRIGYTNDIQKGMSGGPILNNRGELIGINGVNAYPLFGDPYVFEDGSKPNDDLKEKMTRSSWGVPIQTVVQQLPELTAPNPVKDIDNIAKNITVLITQPNDPNDNGSGVIIAREGSTYYILTAGHVLKNQTTYEVTTPDGRCYPVDYHTVKKTEGTDLAVLQFFSSETYPVATLGKYNFRKTNAVVFVNGWAGSGSTQGSHGKPSRFFTPGTIVKDTNSQEIASLQITVPSSSSDSNAVDYTNVTPPQQSGGSVFDNNRQMIGASIPRIPVSTFVQVTNPGSLENGYEMVYTSITAPGVSGGPVLDTRGQVIGIHGREDGFEDIENYKIQDYSLGISMSTFLSQISQLGIKPSDLKVETTAPPPPTSQQKSEIVRYLRSIPRKPKNTADANEWFNYGNQLWRVNENKEAIEALDKATKLKPKFFAAWYTKGLIFKFQTRYPESKTSFDQAIALFDKRTPTQVKAFTWRDQARVLSYMHKDQDALASIDQGINLKSNIDNFTLHILYGLRGYVLLKLNRYAEAKDANTESIRLSPYPLAYYNRGVANANLKEYTQAIADYTQAIKLQPDYADAYSNRCNAHANLKEYTQAIADCNQAIKLQPKSAITHNNRGYTYLQLQDYKRAIMDFNQAIKIDHKSAIAFTNRGAAYYSLVLNRHLQKLNSNSYIASIETQLLEMCNDNIKEDKQAQADLNQALADSSQAIKLQADYVQAYLARGITYAGLNKYEPAIDNFAQAIKLQPNNAIAYLLQGNVRCKKLPKPDYLGAIADYTQAIKLQPNNANAYISRGTVRRQLPKPDYSGVIEDYSQVIKLQPDNANVYLVRGDVYLQLPKPDYPEAIKDYSQAIKLQPNNANAYLERGNVRVLSKDYQGALADYTQGINLQPKNANAYTLRGVAYQLSREYSKALADYTQGINLQPKNANTYTLRGDVRRQLKDYQGAISDYTQGINLQPNNANAYIGRGDARTKLPAPDYQGALADYTQVINLQPNNANVHLLRGAVRQLSKDYQGALADYTQVINLQPKNANAYILRGGAYQLSREYSKAIADYTRGINLQPKNANAYFALGVVYHIQQDYDTALSKYNQALAKDEKFLPVIISIGHIKYEKGDVEGAIQQWQTVVNIDSNQAEPQMAMAVAFYAKGDQQKGLNMAQAALRLDKSWANVEFLKKNLWGKRLVADAQKVLSHFKM